MVSDLKEQKVRQPLSGKDLILATRPFAKEVRSKSWYYMISALVLLSAALAGTILLPNFVLRLISSVLAGIFVIRTFVIYHDFMHHSILHKSKFANALMTIFGIYILAPTSIWKRSHDYHHKHNSKLFSASIGSYPIVTKAKFATLSKSDQRYYLAIRHPFTILAGYMSMFFIGMTLRSFRNAPEKHIDSLISMILHVAVIVLLAWWGGWQAVLLTVFIPFFMAGAMGAYLFYAQHNFPGTAFADKDGWTYEGAAMESSSYMTMWPIGHWITANIGYHHIHHLNAKIPFYRLPEAMAAIPELQAAKRTSLRIRDIIACLKLKVWDPQQGKMVGLK